MLGLIGLGWFALASSQAAPQSNDLAHQIVNDPGAPQVSGARASLRADERVQGGKAIRIEIAGRGKNVWDSSIASPVTKPINAGDQIILAFWARVEKAEGGVTKVTLPYAAIQQATSPWKPLFNEPVELGPEWKLLQVKGIADRTYNANSLTATIHLATARQTLDFGPIIVLDTGQQH